MSNSGSLPIKLGTFVTYYDLELAMLNAYSLSREAPEVTFDLAETGWISPHALCTLNCWAFDVRAAGGRAVLNPPSGRHQASSFFSSAGVLNAIAQGGAFELIHEPAESGARSRYLSAFQIFPTDDSLSTYVESLSDPKTRRLRLDLREPHPVVDSGHYHDILVRELAGNSFAHAKGVGSLCAAYGFEGSGPQRSPLLAVFRGRSSDDVGHVQEQSARDGTAFLPYVELCVADSHQSNLWTQISKLDPDERRPEFDFQLCDGSQKLTEHEQDVIAALNYATTTDLAGRLARIRQYIADWDGEPSAIATGLYRVRRVVEKYGGQIIIRTDRVVVSVDYSTEVDGDGIPKVGCLRRIEKKRLAPLRGTAITVRIPVEPVIPGQKYAGRARKVPRRSPFPPQHLLVLGEHSIIDSGSPSDRPGLDTLVEAVRRRIAMADESTFAFVLLDGIESSFQVPKSLLVPFVDLLSLVPRSCGLVVIADDDTVAQIQEAAPALRRAAEKQPVEPRAGLVVIGSDRVEPCALGNPDSPGSTKLQGSDAVGPSGVLVSTANLAHQVRTRRLRQVLQSEAVRRQQEGHLYLIPNKYYTSRYYEVEELERDASALSSLSLWLGEVLEAEMPAGVVVNSGFLLRMVQTAVSRIPAMRELPVQSLTQSNLLTVAAQCNSLCTDSETIFVVADVICTGDLIKRFLDVFSHPSSVTLVALVDARADVSPFQVREDSTHVQVDVRSILQDPIEPTRDRGNTPAHWIHRTDPITHLVLRKELEQAERRAAHKAALESETDERQSSLPLLRELRTTVDEAVDLSRFTDWAASEEERASRIESILGKAGRAGGLAAGHFTFEEQHHAYFVNLRTFFSAIEREIHSWLVDSPGCELEDLRNTLGVELGQLRVLCLDADTGLYSILCRALEVDGTLEPPGLLEATDLKRGLAGTSPGMTLWFLLPILVTGSSMFQCLQLAAASEAASVRISVVLNRSGPDKARSLRSIRQFNNAHTRLSEMLSLPLSLESSCCPLCERELRLRGAALAARQAKRPRLRAVLEDACIAARATPVESPGQIGIREKEVHSDLLAREFVIRCLLEKAVLGDIQATWDLRKHLSDASGFAALAAASASSPHRLFTRSRVEDVLHEGSLLRDDEARLTLAEACALWAQRSPEEHSPDSFGRELRGFAHLDPFTLRAYLPLLLRATAGNPLLFSEVVAEAAIQRPLFLDAIEEAPLDICHIQEMRDALNELKSFLTFRGGPVPDLHWLRHHLVQSSGWTYSLSRIQQEINSPGTTGMDLETNCQVFLRRGLVGAQQRLAALRIGSHWHSIQVAGDLDNRWAKVECAATKLVEGIRSGKRTPQAIQELAREVLDDTQGFVTALDNAVSLAPEEIPRLLQGSIGRRSWPDDAVRVQVSEGCRPIACGLEDFREILQHILDNARQHDSDSDRAITTLSFAAGRSESRVTMEVSQSIPVEIPTEKTALGGIRRIEDLITDITGVPPTVQSCEANEPYLVVRFWTWPLQRERRQ